MADAVVYQIFPDRFRRSGRVAAQRGLQLLPWGSDPAGNGFQGGDLYGVLDQLGALQDLGVSCVYLTPIFCSAANHRYHTYDYFQVDPLLGGNEALEALITALHDRGMRLILDGVFNHCGRGFWAFHHLLENGAESPYRDWFTVEQWPLVPYPRRRNERCGYAAWWDLPGLPKFNHANPAVQNYLLQVGRHWLERGIDGWRLDVPDEVPLPFWQDFRRMVRAVNPDAWIVGEIWGDPAAWLEGACFDGVMNYRLAWSCLGFAAGRRLRPGLARPSRPYAALDGAACAERLQQVLLELAPAFRCSQMNLLDSHDVPRALHVLRDDLAALRLALLLLFSLPGAPCLYYGTELGLSGGEEPACREALPQEAEAIPHDLRPWIASLAAVRHSLPALRSADLQAEALRDSRGRAEGLLLQRGTSTRVVLHRGRRGHLPLPVTADRWTVAWPPERCGQEAPASLGPQEGLVLIRQEEPR
ncbi:MAG: glycoside hydrolase family 13 protein [Cyanobium sp.]